jgi:hypothetical protein
MQSILGLWWPLAFVVFVLAILTFAAWAHSKNWGHYPVVTKPDSKESAG